MSLALYLSYGSPTPCGALHAKVRSYMTAAAMQHLDTSSGGAAVGSSLALLMINAMPVENLVDAALTKRFGSAGPLQCSLMLFQNWDDLK